MHRISRWPAIFTGMMLLCGVAHAQSLGDVARQNRQQQQAQQNSDTPKKVYGNDDLPQEGLADNDSSSSVPERPGYISAPAHNSAADASTSKAAQLKSQIRAQESAIASLQSQIDRLNNSIRFVTANAYYNGVQHNERQVEKQMQVQKMQEQLAEQKAKLQELQESARRAGFGNAVYEP